MFFCSCLKRCFISFMPKTICVGIYRSSSKIFGEITSNIAKILKKYTFKELLLQYPLVRLHIMKTLSFTNTYASEILN